MLIQNIIKPVAELRYGALTLKIETSPYFFSVEYSSLVRVCRPIYMYMQVCVCVCMCVCVRACRCVCMGGVVVLYCGGIWLCVLICVHWWVPEEHYYSASSVGKILGQTEK